MIELSSIKAKLLLEYPFFGNIAMTMQEVINNDLESFRTFDNTFEFREEYICALSEQQKIFVLCNSALHEALSHSLRRGNRSPWLWDMSCDYAINALLIENNFEPPLSIRYDKRFNTMSAEEIYARLAEEFLDQEQNDRDYDDRRDSGLEEEKLARAQRELIVQEALKKDEKMQSILEHFLGIVPKGKIDWRAQLRDYIGGNYLSDYTIIPPSKKMLYKGIYLPGAFSKHLELVIAIDSSGSVHEPLLVQFISEVEAIMETFGAYTIHFLVSDDRIRFYQQFTNGETLNYKLIGGGGTDFTPVFDEINNFQTVPQCLVYFTDLDGKFPENEPPYRVLWVSPNNEHLPPFGDVIFLEEEL